MGKRNGYVMVPEDDSQWCRFWNLYPWRTAKKEARKAWATLNPSPELVEQMMRTLAWQVPLWHRQGFGMCYPASWLRGERWNDEIPQDIARETQPDQYGHVPPCKTMQACRDKALTEAKQGVRTLP